MSTSTSWKDALTSAGFTGDLVTPGDADYESALVRFAKNSQKKAGLVAFVKSPEDVSLVIKYASANNIPLVIRGGGHSSGGTSSTDGGIVIDLSRHLKSVRIDEAKRMGYAGGGATWATVDAEAIKHGLATVGGTINHTGVGGVSLGGGYGWLTGEHGLTIDNLLQATIVTSNGSILTVNETTNSDLFWGIRGGGSNFGCVTEFVYRLHPQRSHVFAGPLIFPVPRIAEVAAAAEEWYSNASEKEGLMVITTNKGPMGGPALLAVVFFNGDEEEGKRRFKSLFDLGPVKTLAAMIPYEKLNALQNDHTKYNQNYHFTGGIRTSISPDVAKKVFDKMLETTNAPSEADMKMVVIWEYHVLKKLASVSSDATAFPMRVQRPVTVMMVNWTGDDEQLTLDARQRLDAIKAFSDEALAPAFEEKGGKTELDTGYTNMEMGDPRSEDVARAIFGPNYARLQQLKKKHDPNMVFKTWYPIVPATA
ncbi:hypothetical protein FRC20_003754 [Serendipita sp. 405]|nr:hypothetical protein FRC15_004522 [Serendipita sp. 397]KAG8795766.1 hypothetical protein FRC16_009979 [Serendipita sp. 398]KAG8830698.1 hypothetical protein FRC18_007720 [Serendipita sp. 400]KAG8868242.1 hypothetical protein FRC20_003754 [Serendipita sp. 405]